VKALSSKGATSAPRVKSDLERRLCARVGKPVGLALRTAAEIRNILKANPFHEVAPNRAAVIFLDRPPPADAPDHAVGQVDEEMCLGAREIYVHYPSGTGRSRLRIPAAKDGTARNLNTVAMASR
jgi:uncharacterized protein (DUF1697 family)